MASLNTNNYPSGFESEVIIRELMRPETTTGQNFYVGNNATLLKGERGASDGNKGIFLSPFATIDFAVSQCNANNGDRIWVRPSYTEDVAAANSLNLDVTGVSVIGLGSGTNRPTFTYSATAGTVVIGADNITIYNMIFNASVPTVALAIDIEDSVDYARVLGCTFGVDNPGTDEFNNAVRMVNNNTGCIIEGNIFDQDIGAAVSAILMDADTDKTIIQGNTIRGDYSTANIVGDTTLSTLVLIKGNLLVNGVEGNLNAQPVIELLTNTTGEILDNRCFCNVASAVDAIVADLCMFDGNKYSETVGAASFDLPLKPEHLVQVAVKNAALDDTDDLFDVNVGNCIVYALYATCEVDGDQSPVISLQLDADTGSDVVLATGINTSAVNTTDTITITNGALAINAPGAATAVMDPIVVRAGVIESVKDSGTSGAGVYMWHCVWAPLDVGATITEAA